MRYNNCEKCRYCRKVWNRGRYGQFTDSYYGCYFLPYWGKHIETIGVCPKYNADGTERKWSLANCVSVNNR